MSRDWRARPRVAVVGGGSPTEQEMAWAEAVGTALGRADAVLVCGGRAGVMEAACRGAQQAGGLTVGILPGFDVAEANPYVAIPIVTGLGEGRNLLVVRNAQAVIAVGGGYGTLSEIAFALRRGLPVAGVGTWQLERTGLTVPMMRVDAPEEAVAQVLARIAG